MFISKLLLILRELSENSLDKDFFNIPVSVNRVSRKDYQELSKNFKKRMKYINILL